MKRRKTDSSPHIAFFALLILFCAAFVFFTLSYESFAENAIMLGGAVLVMIIIYYTDSIMWGLGTSGVLLLGYIAYTAITSLRGGTPPPVRMYFHVLWLPLLTLAFSSFISRTIRLERENEDLADQLNRFGMKDKATELKNLRAYSNDAPIYMNISKRYGMGLVLVAWRVRHEGKYAPITPEIIRTVAGRVKDMLRGEDIIYLVSDIPYTCATLLLVRNVEDSSVILERFKNVESTWDLKLHFITAAIPYIPEDGLTAEEMLEQAVQRISNAGKAERA